MSKKSFKVDDEVTITLQWFSGKIWKIEDIQKEDWWAKVFDIRLSNWELLQCYENELA